MINADECAALDNLSSEHGGNSTLEMKGKYDISNNLAMEMARNPRVPGGGGG